MSYDLKIWSSNKPSFEDEFFKKNFKTIDDAVIYQDKGWQIVINNVNTVEEEDIPDEISGLLPGITYCTEINLEPISAPEKARRLLDKISNIIAKTSHGLIVNEQDEMVKTPSGVKRLKAVSKTENKKILAMSWWFINDLEFKKDGLKNLINLIDTDIPEAMPRRYGLYEPPQFKLSEQGKEHFIKFMYDNLYNGVVWYPNKPFDYVHISIPNPIGPFKIGFRVGQIKIEFYEDVLKQPGWPLALNRFWLKASEIINPFFSVIKQGWGGSWWWNGIPVRTGDDGASIAVMIGDPYIELWPGFVSAAEKTAGGLYYINNISEVFDDICPTKIPVPPKIAQRLLKKTYKNSKTMQTETKTEPAIAPYDKFYPEIWPFEGPIKED